MNVPPGVTTMVGKADIPPNPLPCLGLLMVQVSGVMSFQHILGQLTSSDLAYSCLALHPKPSKGTTGMGSDIHTGTKYGKSCNCAVMVTCMHSTKVPHPIYSNANMYCTPLQYLTSYQQDRGSTLNPTLASSPQPKYL